MRSADFRRVYDTGLRDSRPYFAAFCLRTEAGDGPRIGFTLPRAIGKAVVRNRIKRRLREAVRRHLEQLSPEWWIVFNPRPKAMAAPFPELLAEVEKFFLRLSRS